MTIRRVWLNYPGRYSVRLLQNGAVAARTLQVKPDNLIDAPPQNGYLSAPELCLLTLTEHAAVTAPQLAGRRLPAAPQLGSPGLLGRICAVLDCSAHSRGAPASQIATRPSLSGARQSASPRWTPQAVQMEGVISLLSSGQQGQQLTEADLSLRRQHAESVTPHSLRWERHSAPQRASPASLGPAPIAPQGGAAHSGGAAVPPIAQWEAGTRAAASAESARRFQGVDRPGCSQLTAN